MARTEALTGPNGETAYDCPRCARDGRGKHPYAVPPCDPIGRGELLYTTPGEEEHTTPGYDDRDFQDILGEAIDLGEHGIPELEGATAQTFQEAGVMTNNAGLIVTLPTGDQFHLTIVQSRRAA